jgi:glycosyltransferase involved in cell wall biosynthesis
MQHLLDNPEIATAMGKRARELVESKFNWDIIIKQYDELIKEVCKCQ